MSDKPNEPSVAAAMRLKTMQSFWARRVEARAKASAMFTAAAARTNADKRVNADNTFSVRDLCQTALATRDANAAEVEWFSAVLHHYGDGARVHVTLEDMVYVMIVDGDRYTTPLEIPLFRPGGRP